MKYRIHYRKLQDIQYGCETFDDAIKMAERIVEIGKLGHEVEAIDQFEDHKDPDNVRFDYETGAPIQYADADDASEHHLRMMGG